MDPTLASIRDTVRLLALTRGRTQDQRAIVVLNRAGVSGGLNRRQVEEALKMKVDVVIPDMPRQISNAATLGEPAIATCGGLRGAIVELARQVASARLLDASSEALRAAEGTEKKRWSLFRRNR
jgi:pilus assembly protein CpaE